MKKTLQEQIAIIEQGENCEDSTGLFGIDVTDEEASLVIIPVPWDATASYGLGTAQAPQKILEASYQIDHHDLVFDKPYTKGLKLLKENPRISELNEQAHQVKKNNDTTKIQKINKMSQEVNTHVEREATSYLEQNKVVGLLGGEHSCPYGLIKSLAQIHKEFGILHIDAHFDLRKSYEGYQYSHASIMDNVLKDFSEVKNMVSFGIRDFCTQEYEKSKQLIDEKKALVYFDRDIYRHKQNQGSFQALVKEALSFLPQKVYVSFDIDGLETQFCPSTGTPVPGGLHYNEACYLIEELALWGKEIIGFDLCEVAPNPTGNEWDENVAMRLLYKLCGASLHKKK